MSFFYKLINYFVVYAEEEKSLSIDSLGLTEVTKWVVGLSTGLAILSASVCLIRYMIASDGNAVAAAKEDLKTIVIAWVCIQMIGVLVNTIFRAVGSYVV